MLVCALVALTLLSTAVPTTAALPSFNPQEAAAYAFDISSIAVATAEETAYVLVFNITSAIAFDAGDAVVAILATAQAEIGPWYFAVGNCIFSANPRCFIGLAERYPEWVGLVTILEEKAAAEASSFADGSVVIVVGAPGAVSGPPISGAEAIIVRTQSYLGAP